MADLIDRQAAIDAIRKVDDYGDGIAFEVLSHAQRDISLLPSAERRGRWIESEFGAYCSECGRYAYRSNGIPWKSNYCPNCGAKMDEVEE